MIHALILLGSLGLALLGRWLGWLGYGRQQGWEYRWRWALLSFALPPLLLLSSALAVVMMGVGGMMASGIWGSGSYVLAVGIILGAGVLLVILALQGLASEGEARRFPCHTLGEQTVRIAPDERLWAAQVGWWDPCLVISQGVVARLTPGHVRAVLLHEQAHRLFRDPVTFLVLGWLQRLTGFLPKTAELWQALLLLREVRADRWTITQTDALDLAEALWLFAAEGHPELDRQWAIGMGGEAWQERLEAILSPECAEIQPGIPMLWWLVALLPLLAVPLHH